MNEPHDQRFKTVIREFFADFLRLFFADWARRFDLSKIEWFDKELMPDPPHGDQHILDLVARLNTLEPVGEEQSMLALVHIEIESPDKTTLLKPRLPSYYIHLCNRYDLPVLPIVIYLKVGLEGIGTDTVIKRFWEQEVLRFQYLHVGLPGLNADSYLHGDNWLGVALSALMRMPKERASEYGEEALRRLGEAPLTEQQRFLLGDCVEAYLPIDPNKRQEFHRILELNSTHGVRAMNKTRLEVAVEAAVEAAVEKVEAAAEKAVEKAVEKARRAGQIELLEAMIVTRFGPLGEASLAQLRAMSDDSLRQLAVGILNAKSLAELGL